MIKSEDDIIHNVIIILAYFSKLCVCVHVCSQLQTCQSICNCSQSPLFFLPLVKRHSVPEIPDLSSALGLHGEYLTHQISSKM